MAAAVLAICIRESIPSCIRAPPEEETISKGRRRWVARSMPLVIISPAGAAVADARAGIERGRLERGCAFGGGGTTDLLARSGSRGGQRDVLRLGPEHPSVGGGPAALPLQDAGAPGQACPEAHQYD